MPRPHKRAGIKITILQELDDGYFRIGLPMGRICVRRLTRCVECDFWMEPSKSDLCQHCSIVERERIRRASIEAGSRRRKIANLGVAERKRSAKLSLAAPKWRDLDKIRAVYEEAKRLTEETGIAHHVDHYYPLQGLLCSGLHVHHNLRVLPASENCSKSNAQPLEDSPATVAFIKQYGISGLRTWIKWANGEKVRI